MTGGLAVHRLGAALTRSSPFAFSPDGEFLVAGGVAGAVCVEAATGRECFVREDLGAVTAVAWSAPDEAVVFGRDADGDVRVTKLAVPDGGTVAARSLAGLRSAALRVTVSGDGALALVAPKPWRTDDAEDGALLRLESLETAALLSPSRVRGGGGEAVHAMAALSPDGALVAVAYGGGASSWRRTEGTLGAVLAWRWSSGDTRTMMAGGVGAVLDVQWLGVETLMVLRQGQRLVADGTYNAFEPRLLVMGSGRREAIVDSDQWGEAGGFGLAPGDHGLGPTPYGALHDDRKTLLVVGHKRRQASVAPGGVLTALSVETGAVERVRVIEGYSREGGCDPRVGFGAQWTGRGDEVVVLTADGPGGTLCLLTGSLASGGFVHAGAVAKVPRDAVGARVWRAGRWLAVSWAQGAGAGLSGRLAWTAWEGVVGAGARR